MKKLYQKPEIQVVRINHSVQILAGSGNKYNEEVQVYNIYVRKFPKSLLAGIFGFPKMDKFEADAGAQNAPKVSF